MTTLAQKRAAKENIKKAQQKWKKMSTEERSAARRSKGR